MTGYFVDGHVHFWDRPHPQLRWNWLEPDAVNPRLGDAVELKAVRRFLPGDLATIGAPAGLRKVVHVEASDGPRGALAETRWLAGLARATGWPDAAVCAVDLGADDVPAQLEAQLAFDVVRGVRHRRIGAMLAAPSVCRGLAAVSRAGLVMHLDVTPDDFAAVAATADAVPGLRVVVDHAGWPLRRDPEYLALWREGLTELGRRPNCHLKVSGLGMGEALSGRAWSATVIAGLVGQCLDAFGPERVLLGTNWPVDAMYGDYAELVGAYRSAVASLSEAERTAVLHGTAERLYRI